MTVKNLTNNVLTPMEEQELKSRFSAMRAEEVNYILDLIPIEMRMQSIIREVSAAIELREKLKDLINYYHGVGTADIKPQNKI